MTREEFYKHEAALIELQKKLREEAGAKTVGELMQAPEGKAYATAQRLISQLYELVMPWD